MPLQPITASPASLAATLKLQKGADSEPPSTSPSPPSSTRPSFVAVYASLTDGRSWCGDCRAAEPLVNAKFSDREELVYVVYAGQQVEWRKPDNPWKAEPFSVQKLPTLIKITDNQWERLVEEDVYDQKKLDAFVGE